MSMQPPPPPPPPVVPAESPIPEVYVLWHPKCAIGQQMASRIYDWLRPGQGLGPDVFYRSLPAPDGPPEGLPLPLPGNAPSAPTNPPPGSTDPAPGPTDPASTPVSRPAVNLQIIFVLIDDNMISDYAWQQWLTLIAQPSSTLHRAIYPVALDSTAFNAPARISQRNYLRPLGVPLMDPQGPARRKALQIAIRSLLKQVTEAMCRLLLAPLPDTPVSDPGPGGSAPKIAIFLSHAKVDGTTPARRIRDFIYANTQLAAFYDENDIPLGAEFGAVLDSIVKSDSTAALIAVQSQNYATRPWCRRELSIFRKPRRVKEKDATAEQWRLPPIVVVNALEPGAQTTSIPEIGNSTVIRWSADAVEQEEQIVTTVLRDALLAVIHSAMGKSLQASPDQIVINWLPDPTTLLHIDGIRDSSTELEILYPGRGLAGLELDILYDLFPKVSFHNFDQVVTIDPARVTSPDKYRSSANISTLIGFSISFDSKDLLARGFGLEHLRDLLVRLARPILRSGAYLAYAGDWVEREDNFTFDLLRLIGAERDDNSLGGPDTNLKIGRLFNHLAWPHYLAVTPRLEAQWIQCCRIVRITQALAGIDAVSIVPDDAPRDTERFLLNAAVAMSQMRRLAVIGASVPVPGVATPYTVAPMSARIVLGGKTRNYSGFLPGIFEESLLMLENNRPLYILGGFGGAAEVLARCLLGEEPQELDPKWQATHTPGLLTLKKFAAGRVLPPEVRCTDTSLAALRLKLQQIRPNLAMGLRTGLDEIETRELLTTRDMSRAVRLVLKGLAQSVQLALKRT